MMRVSQYTYEIVASKLYHHLVITRRNARHIFAGLVDCPVNRKRISYTDWAALADKIDREYSQYLTGDTQSQGEFSTDSDDDYDDGPAHLEDPDPETDDDIEVVAGQQPVTEFAGLVTVTPASRARKAALFQYCTSLVMAQLLPHNLRNAIAEHQHTQAPSGKMTQRGWSGPLLFPNVERLCIAGRVITALSQQYQRRPTGLPWDDNLLHRGYCAVQSTQYLRIQMPEDLVVDETLLKRDSNFAPSLFERLRDFRLRHSAAMGTLTGPETFTAHNVQRTTPLVNSNGSQDVLLPKVYGVALRFCYAPEGGGHMQETVAQRAIAITEIAANCGEQTVAEHIDVWRNIAADDSEDAARRIVDGIAAAIAQLEPQRDDDWLCNRPEVTAAADAFLETCVERDEYKDKFPLGVEAARAAYEAEEAEYEARWDIMQRDGRVAVVAAEGWVAEAQADLDAVNALRPGGGEEKADPHEMFLWQGQEYAAKRWLGDTRAVLERAHEILQEQRIERANARAQLTAVAPTMAQHQPETDSATDVNNEGDDYGDGDGEGEGDNDRGDDSLDDDAPDDNPRHMALTMATKTDRTVWPECLAWDTEVERAEEALNKVREDSHAKMLANWSKPALTFTSSTAEGPGDGGDWPLAKPCVVCGERAVGDQSLAEWVDQAWQAGRLQ